MDLPRLTPSTEELLKQLWTAPPFLKRVFGSVDRRIALLEQIGQSDEIAAIPSLLELLIQSPSTVSQAAARCLHRLVTVVPCQQFPLLDDSVRSVAWWYGKSRWGQLRPSDISRLPTSPEFRTSILGLLSLHKNGYVRQVAVQELDHVEDGTELPFLLLRLNDWVANVRSSAKVAVQRRLRLDYLPNFARSIFLVVRLVDCSRDDHGDVVRWVINKLVGPEHEHVMRGLLQHDSSLVRRTCFQLARDVEGTHKELLLEVGLHSSDLVVRLRAAQLVRKNREYHQFVPVMEQDQFMPVRREALLARLEQGVDSSVPFLEAALMDRSESMRELARFHLRKAGRTDVSDAYRYALNDKRDLAVALAGLGETGQEQDVGLVTPYLDAPKVAVRVSAVRAFGRLGGESVCEDLLPFLSDEKAKITAAAKMGLGDSLQKLDAEQLWQCVGESPRPHVARTVLELLDRHGSWSGLPYLIQFATSSDESVAYQATQCLLRRFNRVFSTPSQEQKAQIRLAFDQTRQRLDSALSKELGTWLRIRGITGDDGPH